MFADVVGYIDVGTGSYLLTAIAGGIATMWFFLRAKIDKLLGRRPKDKAAVPEPAPAQSTAEHQAAELKQE